MKELIEGSLYRVYGVCEGHRLGWGGGTNVVTFPTRRGLRIRFPTKPRTPDIAVSAIHGEQTTMLFHIIR
jgi:hypothetical protein